MNGKKYTVEQVIGAIPNSLGIVTAIANRLGCDWHTAKKYIDRYPSVNQAYQDEVERITDIAETKLYQAINEGDLQAVKYYLSTKGKRRGYVMQTELSGIDGGAIQIAKTVEVILPPEDKEDI